jgi:8-oxo-dGTP diphosphatase
VLRDVIETIAAEPLLLVAAAVMVDAEHRLLVQQRPPGKSLAGLWEFPGGKIEAAESPEAALIREIGEELGVSIEAQDLMPATFASAALGTRQLVMLVYLCRRWTGDVQPLHASALQWCSIDALAALPMPPADAPLIPLLAALLERIG